MRGSTGVTAAAPVTVSDHAGGDAEWTHGTHPDDRTGGPGEERCDISDRMYARIMARDN